MLIGPYASVFSTYHGLTPADARMTAEETIMPLGRYSMAPVLRASASVM